MTPRTQMWALHADATAADVLATAVASGSSRFPLYGAGLDEVTGLVHVKHAVAVPEDRREHVPAGGLAVAILTLPPLLRGEGLLGLPPEAGPSIPPVGDEGGATPGGGPLGGIGEAG